MAWCRDTSPFLSVVGITILSFVEDYGKGTGGLDAFRCLCPAASLKTGQLEQLVGVLPLRDTPSCAGKPRHAAPRTLAQKTVRGQYGVLA